MVRESAARFGSLLGSMSDVITVADCGRVGSELPAWLAPASLVLLLVRQAPTSAGATVARVDRAAEVMDKLAASSERRVGLVVVGSRPYDPQQLVDAIGGELFGVLPEDPIGAGLAAGAWTVGRGRVAVAAGSGGSRAGGDGGGDVDGVGNGGAVRWFAIGERGMSDLSAVLDDPHVEDIHGTDRVDLLAGLAGRRGDDDE